MVPFPPPHLLPAYLFLDKGEWGGGSGMKSMHIDQSSVVEESVSAKGKILPVYVTISPYKGYALKGDPGVT